MSDKVIIKIENLSKTFKSFERGSSFKEVFRSLFIRKSKETKAVDNINFEIKKGELVGFLGPNGAGKSTTLKMLTGVLFPTSGTAEVMNFIPWKDRKKYVSNIGAVFGQKSQLIWDIPPIDSFNMNKAIFSISDDEFYKTLNEMVELLGVSDIIKKPTRQLSLGERMKCEFIISMLHNPKIVFLDEPTIGLDVIAKEKIREFILKMNRKGITFILTTHDLSDIEQLASRVIIINHGKIVFDDGMQKLKRYSGDFKMISVQTQNKLPEEYPEGICILENILPNEAKFELNTALVSLNRFIEIITYNNIIKDMSISEPPIEKIIKQLYTS